MIALLLTAATLLCAVRPGLGAGPQAKPVDRAPQKEKSAEQLAELRRAARTRIVDALRVMEEANTTFFAQLELTNAGRSLARARTGAANMVDPNDHVSQERVDEFHNFTDEFVRAMDQFATGPMPTDGDYGKRANEEVKSLKARMGLKDLRTTGAKLRKELVALKDLANATVGLQDVSFEDTAGMGPGEFAAHVQRVVARVDVVVSTCGLGPLFAPAIASAKPLREGLKQVSESSQRLSGPAADLDPKLVQAFGDWLAQTVDNARALPKSAPAWGDKGLGSRGALVLADLDRLLKDFGRQKTRWLPR